MRDGRHAILLLTVPIKIFFMYFYHGYYKSVI